jgi:hypothetical protein
MSTKIFVVRCLKMGLLRRDDEGTDEISEPGDREKGYLRCELPHPPVRAS